MMKNKKKIIRGILLICLGGLGLVFVVVNNKYINDVEVENKVSMIVEQYDVESEFEIDGYTIDSNEKNNQSYLKINKNIN